jgi:uncharacterized protein YecE (DUF72 family)
MNQQMSSATCKVPLIGCAGWSIASTQCAHFPVSGSHLERYAAVLPAVEINSSFYRPHRPDTYKRWRDSVPEAFRFSVKMPRAITHERRLQDTDTLMLKFLQEAGELGDKLGCLLVQLPPSLSFVPHVVRDFFRGLTGHAKAPVVCEARHRSWFTPEAEDILTTLGIAQVMADPPVVQQAFADNSLSTAYVRLHGSPQIYHSPYSEEFLTRLEEELRKYQAAGKTAWCIFDNTASGAAMPNALSLLDRFDGKRRSGLKTDD